MFVPSLLVPVPVPAFSAGTSTGTGIVPFRFADLVFLQVHDINSDIFGVIGEGKIMAPTIPVFLLPLLLLLMVIFF